MARTMVLGLGAQKAGTTWLHNYLASVPQYGPGFAKEYHVWDRRNIPLLKSRPSLRRMNRTQAFTWAMMLHPPLYFWYFSHLLKGNANLTSDITPSYCGLDEASLTRIKEGFARRKINLKIIFLIRDPIERCSSAVRMIHKFGFSLEDVDVSLSFDDSLRKYYRADHATLRTRYEEIIPRIQSVFSANQVFFGIYEEMFTPQSIANLSSFLGIPENPGFAAQKFNTTTTTQKRNREVELEMREFYKPTYDYCATLFPQVSTLWHGFTEFC